VLAQFYWKKDFEFVGSQPGFEDQIAGTNAAVVIGNRTFAMNGKFKYEYDLGEEWKKFTGLPFVFAAWVTSAGKTDIAFENELNHALQWGILHTNDALEKEPAEYPANLDPKDYLLNKISYSLDSGKLKALDLFLDYLKKLS
jgi:chorismate dehydratase